LNSAASASKESRPSFRPVGPTARKKGGPQGIVKLNPKTVKTKAFTRLSNPEVVQYRFARLALPSILHLAQSADHLFGILNLVIGIYLKFDFWCLELS
jgi:hypothetical protein